MQTKMKVNTNFFERILQLIEYYKIESVNVFATKHLGYNASQKINRLRKTGNNPSFDIIVDISNKFESIDLNWLLTGDGNMLKTEDNNSKVTEPAATYGKINDLKTIFKLDDEQLNILDKYLEIKIKQVLNKVELKIK